MKKVLIAEDDELTREMIAIVVEGLGRTVIRSSNGRLAREILNDNPDIALLVTDVCMPELDGMELIRTIRETGPERNLPIIIVSGVVKPSEITHLLDIGASRFLGKPINADHLRQYILDYTTDEPVRDSNRTRP